MSGEYPLWRRRGHWDQRWRKGRIGWNAGVFQIDKITPSIAKQIFATKDSAPYAHLCLSTPRNFVQTL